LINELISNSNDDDGVDGDCGSDRDNDVKKSQLEIDFLKTKYNFYNGTKSSNDKKAATTIEIPRLPGVFEKFEIVAP